MNNEKEILKFTENLSDLLKSGLDLSKCLEIIKSDLSIEIKTRIDEGERFSTALSSCRTAIFPQWFIGFICACENFGKIDSTFVYLTNALKEAKKSKEKFVESMIYPFVISVLATICGIIAVFAFSSVFAGNSQFDFQKNVKNACVFGGIFIFSVIFVFFVVLRFVSSVNLKVSLFSALAFLTENNIPIIKAIDCSMNVIESNEKLCVALMNTRSQIMNGKSVSDAFSDSLFDAGFLYESKLASSNLLVCETGAFSKIASILKEKTEKRRKMILSAEQPVLLCLVALYLIIILKSTIMDLIFPEFLI